MDYIPRVKKVSGLKETKLMSATFFVWVIYLKELVHDVLAVNALQDITLLDDMMKICFHELEYKVEIFIIGGSVDVEKLDYIWMASKFF